MHKRGDQTKTLKENKHYEKQKLGNSAQSLKKSPEQNRA